MNAAAGIDSRSNSPYATEVRSPSIERFPVRDCPTAKPPLSNFGMLFRRKLNDVESEWHFRPDCPKWPETNYEETQRLKDDDKICKKCVRLQVASGEKT